MVGIFQSKITQRRRVGLKTATLKDFSGGWDAVDKDDTMSTKFSVSMKNMIIGTDGSVECRFGTFHFADVASVVSGSIKNIYYFNDFLLAVTGDGEIAKVDANGVCSAIWNNAIAATLLGAPTGWSAGLDTITFVPFKKDIAIHNGTDKPLRIKDDYTVGYLADDATGSNVNVPIGKFGCTVANYHVVAGIPSAPTQITITSAGTIGTFPGDPAPNDAINIDIGAYTSLSAKEIRGIAGFRSYLIVFFRDSSLLISLGNYKTDGDIQTHVPLYNDTLPKFGTLSQRTILLLENDIIFGATHGIASAKRNIFAGIIESKTLSEIIRPGYNQISRILTEDQEKLNTWIVQDINTGTIFTNFNGNVIAYRYNDELKVRGWAEVEGWDWDCACTSKQGRVFFAKGSRIYQLGNEIFSGENVYADKINDHDVVFANNIPILAGQKVYDEATYRTWTAQVNLNTPLVGTMLQDVEARPDFWVEYLGEEIDIEWELPWTDFRMPENVKKVRTVKIGSKGVALFTLNAYVDSLYKDEDGNIIHNPALSMDFVGGDIQGFGGSPQQPYGGGRKSTDPRLYKFPLKFKRIKLKVTAAVREKLSISSFTFLYAKGGFPRG